MMRSRFLLALVAFAACGDTTDEAPTQLNLNRPVDMSFACYGGLRVTNGGTADPTQDVIITAQPSEACEIRSGVHDSGTTVPVPMGQEDLSAQGGAFIPSSAWYGFILQSEPGTVALSRWPTQPGSAFNGTDVTVLDSDPLTPGKNGITVGENPIAIATDTLGCYEVTANAGSCDLSVMEVNSALDDDPKSRVDRLDVKNSAGQSIHSKPAAMLAQPSSGVIGVACPAQATGIVYIAYPGCHAVATVDVSTGNVVGGITYDAAGVPTIFTGGNLTCPDECSTGVSTTAGNRPSALDMFVDPRSMRRSLAIGSSNSASITLVELGIDSMPLSLSQVAFQNTTGNLGFLNVALSPQIGMGGSSGILNDETAPGGQFQFLYGVATDHTIRVADILNLRSGIFAECDEQVDPRLLYGNRNIKSLACMPVGDPTTPARRPGAIGPGISLIADSIPVSIAIYKVPSPPDGTAVAVNPSQLVGYFGIITAANGSTFVLNVDDDAMGDLVSTSDPIETDNDFAPPTLGIGNQLRDSIQSRDLLAQSTPTPGNSVFVCDDPGPDPDATSGNTGGTRAPGPPTKTVPPGVIAAEKVGNMPQIRQVTCTSGLTATDNQSPVSELTFSAPIPVRDLEFPDLRGLRGDENWTLTYEGSLSEDSSAVSIDGPGVRSGMIGVDSFGMHLVDQTHPFCDAGVETNDFVQLDGCDPSFGDTDCPFGYVCFVHPDSQVTNLGACMLADEADRLADACKDYLTSLRRYTVGHSAAGELQLVPRKHVLRTTPIDGCTSSAQCQALATYADSNASSLNPIDDKTPPNGRTWTCAADPARAPEPGTGNRCIEACTTSLDCDPGTVCNGGFCMEGVEPPQSCVNAPQRYELHAGEAFTVLGSVSGYIHRVIADANNNCIIDPAQSPLETSRVPLTALPCDPTADPRTGRNPAGVLEPNPCQLTTTESEFQPQFTQQGISCSTSGVTVFAERPTTAIRLRARGMTLTLVDPTYPGDLTCNGDRLGPLANVPLVFPGYQLTFRQTAGFSPLLLSIQPSYPIKVLRGPLESIWVIDNGDFLSIDFTQASTRGKVFRVESTNLAIVDLLE